MEVEAPPLGDDTEIFEGEDERDDPSTLPIGFKFCPSDEEIITCYLVPKVRRQALACEGVVIDVELHKYNPMMLTEMYADRGHDGIWYFFTPRNRKYEKGNRPDRAAFEGYWKATDADTEIKSRETRLKIGAKKPLVFHKTRDRKLDPGTKTKWMMVEYKIEESSQDFGTWVLDDYVFCKIYQTRGRRKAAADAAKGKNIQPQQVQPLNESSLDLGHEHGSVPSQIEQSELNQTPCLPSTSYANSEMVESQTEIPEPNQTPCPPSTSYANSEMLESQTEKPEPNQTACPPSTSYSNSEFLETLPLQSELHKIFHPREPEPSNAHHCSDEFLQLIIPDLPPIGPDGDFNCKFQLPEQFNYTSNVPHYALPTNIGQEPFQCDYNNMYGYQQSCYPYNISRSYNYGMDQITAYNFISNSFQAGPANYNIAADQPSMHNYHTGSRFQPNTDTSPTETEQDSLKAAWIKQRQWELLQSQKRV